MYGRYQKEAIKLYNTFKTLLYTLKRISINNLNIYTNFVLNYNDICKIKNITVSNATCIL